MLPLVKLVTGIFLISVFCYFMLFLMTLFIGIFLTDFSILCILS